MAGLPCRITKKLVEPFMIRPNEYSLNAIQAVLRASRVVFSDHDLRCREHAYIRDKLQHTHSVSQVKLRGIQKLQNNLFLYLVAS